MPAFHSRPVTKLVGATAANPYRLSADLLMRPAKTIAGRTAIVGRNLGDDLAFQTSGNRLKLIDATTFTQPFRTPVLVSPTP